MFFLSFFLPFFFYTVYTSASVYINCCIIDSLFQKILDPHYILYTAKSNSCDIYKYTCPDSSGGVINVFILYTMPYVNNIIISSVPYFVFVYVIRVKYTENQPKRNKPLTSQQEMIRHILIFHFNIINKCHVKSTQHYSENKIKSSLLLRYWCNDRGTMPLYYINI